MPKRTTPELLRLADEVKAAYDGLGIALDAFEVAETRWLNSNPAPDKESGRAWHEWAYGPRSGYDEADAAAGVASDKLHAAIAALNATPARTLRGLIVKVRLGEIDQDALGNLIHPSIIDDLRALADVESAVAVAPSAVRT